MLEYIRLLFGSRVRLPRDHSTRLPRSARKAVASESEALARSIQTLADMPGLAEFSSTQRLPAGFYAQVQKLWQAYDAYADAVRKTMGWEELPRAGKDAGCDACYTAPVGVSPAESLMIARQLPKLPRLKDVAEQLQSCAQQQIEDIQAANTGKNPEKASPLALQKGRQAYDARALPCPFLDEGQRRCMIWEHRPIACRMHHLSGDPQKAKGDHPDHANVEVKNIRLPVKQQLDMSTHIDRRMGDINPLLFAGVLQAFHIGEGQPVREQGEAAMRIGRDGRPIAAANKNVKGAKKFQKNKKNKGKRK